jgi:hypothetical protein
MRVVNTDGLTVPIRFDQLKHKTSGLAKLNAIPQEIREDMDEGQKQHIVEKNKRNAGSNLDPIVCLRTLVSKKKKRLLVEGYNLDLTYITNFVIAMGYPAKGTESTIRNKKDDVVRFLRERHGQMVKIYNLCLEPSRQYEHSEIPEFGYGKYQMVDHNICSTRTLFNICMDMFLFLQRMIQ